MTPGQPGLGQPSSSQSVGQPAQPAELVPFTDFDADLAGADILLGGLEDVLELAPAQQQYASSGGRQAGNAQSLGAAAPELVPFLDFDEGLAGADDLLEGSLEPGTAEFEEGAGADSSQERLSQPFSLTVASGASRLPLSDSSAGRSGTGQLAGLLAAAAEVTGLLAAVDAVQYVSALALQQAQQLRHQHCSELAAFQWVNEHLLPPEACEAAAALLAGAELSATAAGTAGAAVPPVHPAVAAWALRSSRQQVLQQLLEGTGTLQSLEAPLKQWQQQMAATGRQLEAEVAAAVPYAAAALQQQLQQQQQWLGLAGRAAASLLEVSQAVLQFEASRTADAQAGADLAGAAADVVLPAQQQQPAVVDRYQAEQQLGWRRYSDLLRQMQQLQGSYAAAEVAVAAAVGELQQLRLRRQEATSIMQSAEAAGSNAAANFAALALPLIKSSQQLPQALTRLLPLLAGSRQWAEQLLTAQRRAGELVTAEGDEGAGFAPEMAAEARQAAQRLASAAACVQQLPAAVQGLQAALLPTRNRLLAGRRGEAAAQAQAADVVDSLSASVTQLHPQLDRLEEGQRWLATLPASLQALASRADQRAAALQQQHGFSLHGLEQLLLTAEEAQPASGTTHAAPAVPSGGMLSAGLLLPTGCGGCVPAQGSGGQQRREFAASVLTRFRAKLAGEARPSICGSSNAQAAKAEGSSSSQVAAPADVAQQVQQLIEEATSPGNLARMYEGWMPWV